MRINNIVYFVLVLSIFSCSVKTKETPACTEFSVKLIVDYGNSKKELRKDITSQRQLTALEALQHASVVETHPVGNYVFVSSIDSVKSIKDVKGWYYKVNGEFPGTLAINNKINNGDTICWVYKEDVCSRTIDNK